MQRREAEPFGEFVWRREPRSRLVAVGEFPAELVGDPLVNGGRARRLVVPAASDLGPSYQISLRCP